MTVIYNNTLYGVRSFLVIRSKEGNINGALFNPGSGVTKTSLSGNKDMNDNNEV